MKFPLALAVLTTAFASVSAAQKHDFHDWALRPPMGWNSWDNFGTTITEAQTREQTDYMAAHLKRFGWEYVVVDIQWYEPNAKGHDYRPNAELAMDGFGRLLPAPNRFPSAADGAGFKALADYVHAKGLKFGIHLMRGIPRKAVAANLPVKGTAVHAQDIADKASICPWNPDMYGVDMSKPGAQEYYNSVFELIASWGVDYVKVDDISRPYQEHAKEIEGIRKAIDATGRPIVLSLSPGETALSAADHVADHANLWRISDDFWDNWPALYEQFGRLEKWNPFRRPGAWPDADMLPLGVIDLGRRNTRFTPDEQVTLMTLWSIARSPLMHGGDMTKTDDFTLSLLTNSEVLAVNQDSANNRPLFNTGTQIAWVADVPGTKDKYVALFNARGQVPIEPERAAFRSGRVARGTDKTAVPFEVDVSGAAKVVLVIDDCGDGNDGDQGLWVEPRLVDSAGKESALTDLNWVNASGGWSQFGSSKSPGARPVSVGGRRPADWLSATAKSIIEYNVPAGATKLRGVAALDDRALRAKQGGTVEFMIFVAKPGGDLDKAGLPVAVRFADLGLSEQCSVRDLWAQKDLGTFRGSLSQEIHWHGAGLYRLSPR